MNTEIPWGNNAVVLFLIGSGAFTGSDPGYRVAETIAEEEQKVKSYTFVFLHRVVV